MHEEIHESPANTGLDDSLDLVVGAVREVRDGPARVNQNLIVERVNELRENGEGRRDLDTWLVEVLTHTRT